MTGRGVIGIDAPERRQPFSARAKQEASELAFGGWCGSGQFWHPVLTGWRTT